MRLLNGTWTRLTTVGALVLLLSGATVNADFPPKGDDVTTSTGSYQILVGPQWVGSLTGCPVFNPGTPENGGWDAGNRMLHSETLTDSATTIGRSDPHDDGSPADAGTPVGTANTMVGDNNFPSWGLPAFEGPAGTREVHTEIRQLFMENGAADQWVQAGSGNSLPLCPGEVETKQAPPGGDFPAESFFNIYMEAGVPPCGAFDGATVYNEAPLIVTNNDLNAFPPEVVYIHGGTPAVPVYFKDTNPGKWNAGDLFGLIVLAGHGVQVDVSVFWTAVESAPEMQIPAVSQWGALVMTLLVLAAATIIIRRGRALRARA